MSLVKCVECGNVVSDQAKTCPSCGISRQSKTAVRKGLAVVVAVGFGFVAAVVAGTVFIMNGHESIMVPGLLAFAVGALTGWYRVMK
jgi:RNA polymerase subunit RPABC4/transcription elongation factor Spt4